MIFDWLTRNHIPNDYFIIIDNECVLYDGRECVPFECRMILNHMNNLLSIRASENLLLLSIIRGTRFHNRDS